MQKDGSKFIRCLYSDNYLSGDEKLNLIVIKKRKKTLPDVFKKVY